ELEALANDLDAGQAVQGVARAPPARLVLEDEEDRHGFRTPWPVRRGAAVTPARRVRIPVVAVERHGQISLFDEVNAVDPGVGRWARLSRGDVLDELSGHAVLHHVAARPLPEEESRELHDPHVLRTVHVEGVD